MPKFNFTISTSAIKDVIKDDNPPDAIHTIEQCFVDLNIELNEKVNTSFPNQTASFRKGLYNLSEGSDDIIYVDLNSPSTLGIEELDLAYVGSSGLDAVVSQDLAFNDTNLALPIRLSWGIGEQSKQIPFSALTDYNAENTEEFYFRLTNFINCKLSGIQDTTIRVENVENLAFVYIQPYNALYTSASADSNGNYNLVFTMPEGSQLKLGVFLSYPSVYGLEEVDVVFTNQSTKAVDYNISNTHSPLAFNSESSYTKELNESTGVIIAGDFAYTNYYDYSTGYYDDPIGSVFIAAETIEHNYKSTTIQDPSNQIQNTSPTLFVAQSSGEYSVVYYGTHNVDIYITLEANYQPASPTSINASYTVNLLIYKNGSIIKEQELYTNQINTLITNINIPLAFNIPLDILASDQLTFKLQCNISDIIISSNNATSSYAVFEIKTIDTNLDIIKTLGEVVHLNWAIGELAKAIEVDIVSDDISESIEEFTIELKNAVYSNIVADPTSVILIPDTRFPKLTVKIQS
jgi:hypothetical protein